MIKRLPLFEAETPKKFDIEDKGDVVNIWRPEQKREGEPLFGAMDDGEFWDTYDFKKCKDLGAYDTKEEAVKAIKAAAGINESVQIAEGNGKFVLTDSGIDFVPNGSAQVKTQKPNQQAIPKWDEPIADKPGSTTDKAEEPVKPESMVDIISSQTPDNNDNKLASAIDAMGKAAESGDKAAITAAYKTYLAELKSQLGLSDKELIKYILKARKLAQDSVIGASDNKKAKEFSTSIEVMNDTLRELGVDVSGASSAATPDEPAKPKRLSPKVNPDEWVKFGKTFANVTNIKVDVKNTTPDENDQRVTWYNVTCTDTKGRKLVTLIPSESTDVDALLNGSTSRDGMTALRDYLMKTYK